MQLVMINRVYRNVILERSEITRNTLCKTLSYGYEVRKRDYSQKYYSENIIISDLHNQDNKLQSITD